MTKLTVVRGKPGDEVGRWWDINDRDEICEVYADDLERSIADYIGGKLTQITIFGGQVAGGAENERLIVATGWYDESDGDRFTFAAEMARTAREALGKTEGE